MKYLSTADMIIDEVAIYCWYEYWWSSYLLLIWSSIDEVAIIFTADMSIDEVGIYCIANV